MTAALASNTIDVAVSTCGTAPKEFGQDNPGSLILSGGMVFRYMGRTEAADLIIKGISGAIAAKTMTYDSELLVDGATNARSLVRRLRSIWDDNSHRPIDPEGAGPSPVRPAWKAPP